MTSVQAKRRPVFSIVEQLLADYELYAGATVPEAIASGLCTGRLETVHARFKDVPGRWRTGSLLLVRVYLALAKPNETGEVSLKNGAQQAAKVAQGLVDTYPKSAEAEEARTVLKILAKEGQVSIARNQAGHPTAERSGESGRV